LDETSILNRIKEELLSKIQGKKVE
jgi:hypothetical protein